MKNQRARSKDEKKRRKEDILSAALQLLLKNGEVASVIQIATASGIAKGTVYLYFNSKEEIYLNLFQQEWDPLFAKINREVSKKNSQIADITNAIASYVTNSSYFLPLMTACSGMLGRTKEKEVIRSYQQILAKNLEKSSQLLSNRFGLDRRSGVNLFLRTYAIIFGMWDVIDMTATVRQVFIEEDWTDFPRDFKGELQKTLLILWHGMITEDKV